MHTCFFVSWRFFFITVFLIFLPACQFHWSPKKIILQKPDPALQFPFDIPLPLDAILLHDDGSVGVELSRKYIFSTKASKESIQRLYRTELSEAGWSMQYIFKNKHSEAVFVVEKPSKKMCIIVNTSQEKSLTFITIYIEYAFT